ncbi:MAG: hypothetical protein GAK45_00028 [Pseudomonas citronellolis]|nr:MAG: hypothetical protein GAK45_00028 [Pseudomonas citronellolis]
MDHRPYDVPTLERTYEFAAPPEKVWRALCEPALRERWLPGTALRDAQPEVLEPQRRVRYQLRDEAPPHLLSEVTFEVTPNASGGTHLRLLQTLSDTRLAQAANDAMTPLCCAA